MIKKAMFKIAAIALLAGSFFTLLQSNASALLFTDVVGKGAITSFKAMLEALPDKAISNESGKMWVLTTPDKSVFFAWSVDKKAVLQSDIMFWFSANPFLKAGLDINKFPKELLSGDKIVIGAKIKQTVVSAKESITPLSSFEQIVESDRDRIGYHSEMDHYGLNFSGGNVFEWAKNIGKNDKDIVFVLNPQIFIEAGVNPSKVEGWIFGQVTVADSKGKMVKVDKFLKPFNLK